MLDARRPPASWSQVRDLKMYFPIYTGLLRRHTGDVKAVDGVSFDILRGRDAGPCGRIRLRQIHRRAARCCGFTSRPAGRS